MSVRDRRDSTPSKLRYPRHHRPTKKSTRNSGVNIPVESVPLYANAAYVFDMEISKSSHKSAKEDMAKFISPRRRIQKRSAP